MWGSSRQRACLTLGDSRAGMTDVPKMIGLFRVVRQLPSSATHDAYVAEGTGGKTVVLKVFDAPVRNQGLLDPKVAETWGLRGSVHQQRGDREEAIMDFERYLELAGSAALPEVRAALENVKAGR